MHGLTCSTLQERHQSRRRTGTQSFAADRVRIHGLLHSLDRRDAQLACSEALRGALYFATRRQIMYHLQFICCICPCLSIQRSLQNGYGGAAGLLTDLQGSGVQSPDLSARCSTLMTDASTYTELADGFSACYHVNQVSASLHLTS